MTEKDNNVKANNSIELNNEKNFSKMHLVLDVVKNEYQIEVEKGKALETKAGVALALVGVLITFIPSIIHKTQMDTLYVESIKYTLIIIIFYLLLIVIAILLTISAFFLTHVLLCEPYERIDITFFDEKFFSNEEIKILRAIIDVYKKILVKDKKVTKNKAKCLNKGIFILVNSLVLLMLIIIISIFI